MLVEIASPSDLQEHDLGGSFYFVSAWADRKVKRLEIGLEPVADTAAHQILADFAAVVAEPAVDIALALTDPAF